jgi:hypothetical protein
VPTEDPAYFESRKKAASRPAAKRLSIIGEKSCFMRV